MLEEDSLEDCVFLNLANVKEADTKDVFNDSDDQPLIRKQGSNT